MIDVGNDRKVSNFFNVVVHKDTLLSYRFYVEFATEVDHGKMLELHLRLHRENHK